MITQTFRGQDFLHPNHCLHLMAAGLTNKTAFCWQLNNSKTLASLEFRPLPHDAEVEEKFIYKALIPAYTATSLLSFFPDLIHIITNGRVELGISKIGPVDSTNVDVFTEAPTLNEATFQLINDAIAVKIFDIGKLNAHLHQFNNATNYQGL